MGGTITITQQRMQRRNTLGIDHNISVSEMQQITTSTLKTLRGVTEITDAADTESLAVLVPYNEYLNMQEAIVKANTIIDLLGK